MRAAHAASAARNSVPVATPLTLVYKWRKNRFQNGLVPRWNTFHSPAQPPRNTSANKSAVWRRRAFSPPANQTSPSSHRTAASAASIAAGTKKASAS